MMRSPRWHTVALRLAGAFNIAFGVAVMVVPEAMYRITGMAATGQLLINLPIWQCLGLVLGLYGVGYFISANDPRRHWLMILVGFLSKVLGPLGVLFGALRGELPWAMLPPLLVTDAIWWLPLGLILHDVWSNHRDDVDQPPADPPEIALAKARTQSSATLAELSHVSPVLLVFLRHFG